MASIIFQLRKPNSERSSITMRFRWDYHDFRFDLKDNLGSVVKIPPPLWDSARQQPIKRSNIPSQYRSEIANIENINIIINRTRLAIEKILIESNIISSKIDNEYIRKKLLEELKLTKDKNKSIKINDYILELTDEMHKGSLLIEKSKKKYSEETIKQYKNLSKEINNYKSKSTFPDIDQEWYNEFIIHLQRNNYTASYIGNFIKNLKVVMRIALTRKVSNNENHLANWFIKPKGINATKLYLSETEIKQIYEFQLVDENEYLDKYRDMFLVGCYTGLRVSDYKKLTKENFNKTEKGNYVISVPTKKTGENAVLPIVWSELLTIAEKYDYKFPKLDDQKINKYIKIICKMIGFTDTKSYYVTKGGKNVLITKEKYNEIATHTGRRSAITNLHLRGLSYEDICKFTGHKKLSIIDDYNKASTQETADIIIEKIKNRKNESNSNSK